MKKAILSVAAFCLMLALSTTITFAQNNTAMGSTDWTAEVEIPINVTAGGSVDLGKIAPGTTRNFLNADVLAITFDVTGAPNVPFLITTDVVMEDGGLELGPVSWEYYNDEDTWTEFGAETEYWLSDSQGAENYPGLRKFRVMPSTLTCPASAMPGEEAIFTVTLTATYTDY